MTIEETPPAEGDLLEKVKAQNQDLHRRVKELEEKSKASPPSPTPKKKTLDDDLWG